MTRLALLVGALLGAAASAGTPAASPPQPSARRGTPARHAATFAFRTADGVSLDGAIVGAGRRGVVLVHEAGALGLCGWWPYAVRLAGKGSE